MTIWLVLLENYEDGNSYTRPLSAWSTEAAAKSEVKELIASSNALNIYDFEIEEVELYS